MDKIRAHGCENHENPKQTQKKRFRKKALISESLFAGAKLNIKSAVNMHENYSFFSVRNIFPSTNQMHSSIYTRNENLRKQTLELNCFVCSFNAD